MEKLGRPKTREREAFMWAIWRAVQVEIHVRGATSVRQACQKLFETRADGLIKFVDERGTILDDISGAGGAETLRHRYMTADRAIKDAARYPELAARAANLQSRLPGKFEKVKALQAELRWRKAHDNWLDDYPG